MKFKNFVAALCLLSTISASPAPAAEKGDPKTDLTGLIESLQADLQAGKTSKDDLNGDLKKFDELLQKYHGQKTEGVAEILYSKATFYAQALGDQDQADALMERIVKEFPGTEIADSLKEQVAATQRAKKIQALLIPGKAFPDFQERDSTGQPLSISGQKGHVVLVDFWATWCGPCKEEMPNVKAVYEKYHGQGLEIIGVSLDQELAALQGYTRSEKIPWPQYFDGQGFDNKLAQKYGIMMIPSNFLLDQTGKILAKDLRGDDLQAAVAKALQVK
ncbi:MAG: redoxin domain-containing protein [Chthoniobacteraceae bacterium]